MAQRSWISLSCMPILWPPPGNTQTNTTIPVQTPALLLRISRTWRPRLRVLVEKSPT